MGRMTDGLAEASGEEPEQVRNASVTSPVPPLAPSARAALGSVAERLSTLEQSLLGGGALPQGQSPLERVEWLETQLGTTMGTLLQRLDALEQTAKALGLL